MKNILLVATFMVLPVCMLATIHTVSNDPNHPGQFTSLQAAHDAAVNDDTLLWYGNNSVGSLSLTKRLVIVGLQTDMSFSGLSISIQANTADGSQILSGKYSYLQFGGGISASIDVSNSLFSYISISNGNIMCTNCIIGDMANASSSEGSTFLNCIFTSEGNIGGSYPGGISTSFINTNSSYLFDHCIFLDNLLSTGASNPLPQVIFSNCIFSGFNASNCFPVNTAFNSNLFIDFSIDNTGFCNPLVASNNIMNAPDPYVNGNLSNILTADFNLTVTSAGNNAASDGTDIGLHGGVHAWPLSYHYGAYPPGVPVVNSLTLENYIIGTSDQLQMNAQGSIPSNE